MNITTVALGAEEPRKPLKLLMTIPEVAQALAISVSMVRKLIRLKRLKAHKIGARTLVHIAEMRRYISSLEML